MALFVLTINNLSPALDRRDQELERIIQFGEQALRNARAAGSTVTSGNVTAAGSSTVVGSYVYTPQASS